MSEILDTQHLSSEPSAMSTDLDCGGKGAEDRDVLGPVDGQEEDPAGRLGHGLVVDVGAGGGGRGGDGEHGDGGRQDVEHLGVQGGLQVVEGAVAGVGGGGVLEGLFEMMERVEHDELLLVVVHHLLRPLLQEPGDGRPAPGHTQRGPAGPSLHLNTVSSHPHRQTLPDTAQVTALNSLSTNRVFQ